MIKKILIILLFVCTNPSCTNIKNNRENTIPNKSIAVGSVFDCYDLDKLSVTNGAETKCREDRVNKSKVNYNRNLAIDKINNCLSRSAIAILTLTGRVICTNNDKNSNK